MGMTNAEGPNVESMTNAQMTNDERPFSPEPPFVIREFVILHAFVIRISTFVIHRS